MRGPSPTGSKLPWAGTCNISASTAPWSAGSSASSSTRSTNYERPGDRRPRRNRPKPRPQTGSVAGADPRQAPLWQGRADRRQQQADLRDGRQGSDRKAGGRRKFPPQPRREGLGRIARRRGASKEAQANQGFARTRQRQRTRAGAKKKTQTSPSLTAQAKAAQAARGEARGLRAPGANDSGRPRPRHLRTAGRQEPGGAEE